MFFHVGNCYRSSHGNPMGICIQVDVILATSRPWSAVFGRTGSCKLSWTFAILDSSHINKNKWLINTLPETNGKAPENDGWNISFLWDDQFSGQRLVFRGVYLCKWFHVPLPCFCFVFRRLYFMETWSCQVEISHLQPFHSFFGLFQKYDYRGVHVSMKKTPWNTLKPTNNTWELCTKKKVSKVSTFWTYRLARWNQWWLCVRRQARIPGPSKMYVPSEHGDLLGMAGVGIVAGRFSTLHGVVFRIIKILLV